MGLCYVRFTGLVFRQICNLPDSFSACVSLYRRLQICGNIGGCGNIQGFVFRLPFVFRQICNLPDFQYRKNPAIPQSTINKIGFTLYRWEATKVAANSRMLMTI